MNKLIISVLFIFNTINLYADMSLQISAWDLDAINASRIIYSENRSADNGKKNLYLSSVMKKNVMTENVTTEKHLAFLDPETLEPLSEQVVGELAGTPIYDPEGRYVIITSKDGWISKYNLQTGMPEIKVRVGIKTANSALSGNAHFLMVGNRQPADLVFLNPDDLSVVRILPVQDRKGVLSPVNVVRNAGELHGFIVAPQDFPQIWKVSYLDPPPIGFGDGWNHDYRCLKDHMDKPLFPVKRITIEQTLNDFYIDEQNIYLLGSNADGEGIIFDLDLSRIVSHLDVLSLAPDLIWQTNEASQLAILNKDKTSLSFYGNSSHLGKWKKQAQVGVDVSHVTALAACPQAETIWVGEESGNIQIINKQSHAIEHLLQPAKGRIQQISCTENNKYMILNVGEDKNFMLVYDTMTYKIVRQFTQQ